jgi:hypothetical protein
MAWQLTVINGGASMVRGGITFATGETVIESDTLELLNALGLVNSITAPNFTYNFGEVDTEASGSLVFTGGADFQIVAP